MKQGEYIGDYQVLHSIRLDSYTHVVAQNTAAEDEHYRLFRINSGNLLGIADCALVYENRDYLKVMRKFIDGLGAGLDSLGLDRVYRGSPDWKDAPIKAEDCYPDSSKMNFEGQVVAVKAGVFHPEYRAASHQLHLATGGFGCSPTARGRTVYCTNIYSGENDTFRREDIAGVVLPEVIPKWAREKIAKIRENQPDRQQQKAVQEGEKITPPGNKPSVLDEIKQSRQDERARSAKAKESNAKESNANDSPDKPKPARKKSEPDL